MLPVRSVQTRIEYRVEPSRLARVAPDQTEEIARADFASIPA
jgi:hypothetical protein